MCCAERALKDSSRVSRGAWPRWGRPSESFPFFRAPSKRRRARTRARREKGYIERLNNLSLLLSIWPARRDLRTPDLSSRRFNRIRYFPAPRVGRARGNSSQSQQSFFSSSDALPLAPGRVGGRRGRSPAGRRPSAGTSATARRAWGRFWPFIGEFARDCICRAALRDDKEVVRCRLS